MLRTRSAALTAAFILLTLTAATFAPLARAGTLPEDLANARDGDQRACPSQPLDALLLCIVEEVVINNPYVQVLREHVSYHYQNASRYRNETVVNAVDVTFATLSFEYAVESATLRYALATYGNGGALVGDVDEVARDLSDYAGDAAYRECRWTIGFRCPADPTPTDDEGRVDGDSLWAPTFQPNTCDNLFDYIRCHYSATASEAANATGNATRDTNTAVNAAKARQDGATYNYTSAVDSARRVYVRALILEADQQYVSTYGFATRECRLLLTSCPLSAVPGTWPAWIDDAALDFLA